MMGIRLPDDAYAVYRLLAAPKGLSVSEYLTARARAHSDETRARRTAYIEAERTTRAEVERLHALGWDDGLISQALDKPRGTIAATRRRLGLEPNQRKDIHG